MKKVLENVRVSACTQPSNLWGKHFEDFKVGDKFTTEGRTVTETDIVIFCGLAGDFSFMHTNEELAKKTVYGTRILPGLLTLAISEGLILRVNLFDGMEEAQFVGIHDLRFTGAVKPGDTIRVKFEIMDKKKSNRPGYGIITLRRTVINQRGETVLTAETSGMKKMTKQEGCE